MRLSIGIGIVAITAFTEFTEAQSFAHPGMLHKQSDLDRMRTQVAARIRPEGGGGNYGSGNGGYDQLGYGTLTATIAPASPILLVSRRSGKVSLRFEGGRLIEGGPVFQSRNLLLDLRGKTLFNTKPR